MSKETVPLRPAVITIDSKRRFSLLEFWIGPTVRILITYSPISCLARYVPLGPADPHLNLSIWRRAMKKATWTVLLILALTAGSFIRTYALSSYKAMFNYEYKTSGTALDSCKLCHIKGSRKRNSYGKDFEKGGRSFNIIEEHDSDGDGFNNLNEIASGTFPGDPQSKPDTPLDFSERGGQPNSEAGALLRP